MNVSVIVPVYNIGDCVTHCIESLLAQDLYDMEIILVDDGSQDCSAEICDCWAARDNRIKVVHKLNGGLSSARNAGLDVAVGRYVLFVDGDDYLAKGALSILLHIITILGVDFVQFGYEEVGNYEEINSSLELTPEQAGNLRDAFFVERDKREMFRQLYVLGGVAASACTKLMRTEMVRKLRFKEGIVHEDEQFTSRLLAHANSVCYATELQPYKYVMRDGSIIHTAYKPNKIYNLSDIYEERLEIVSNLGFLDIQALTAKKYAQTLIILFGTAYNARDKKVCSFIRHKLLYLCNEYDISFTGVNRIIVDMLRLRLPSLNLYYALRRILGK